MSDRTEQEVDEIVVDESEDDHAWELPIRVNGQKGAYEELNDDAT